MQGRTDQIKNAIKDNLYTSAQGIRIHRDRSVVLMGAWMGTKFADNSRYLYQYLFENRKKLGLKEVIWVTRDKQVNKSLNDMGYHSCLIGTKKSDYWHLKAGIHILCNAVGDIPNFHSDIDSRLSFGAKKIQLWHGVGGIKAVGLASNKSKQNTDSHSGAVKKILGSNFYKSWTSPGNWINAYVLATSKESAQANIGYIGCSPDRIFISGYPRNCECLKYLPEEEEFIDKLRLYTGSILYLPTFRSDDSDYVHPLKNDNIRKYIKRNNILWIEKPHTADIKGDAVVAEDANICNLDSSFDINTIYDKVSCVMTDYSSVAFDAVYHKKPLIMYCPDIDEFRHGDVGFMIDFESYFRDELCENLDDTLKLMQEAYQNSNQYLADRKDSYWKINEYAFDNRTYSYEEIWNDICALK